jgi:NADH dehydrogenase FAD-containing subunit
MSEKRPQLVVIGGGYAGVLAANRLRQLPNGEVTLINAGPEFVERIRLHELAAGSGSATVEFASLLADGVHLVVDEAVRIDVAGRRVLLAGGEAVDYDYLIYAVGSRAAQPNVPGGAEFAYPLGSLDEAQRLAAALAGAVDAPVCVVGAGPTGIEAAAELAEQGRRVTLVCGTTLGPYLSIPGRRSVVRRLRKLGVEIVDGPGARVVAVAADAVVLSDGRRLASGVTVWTAGFGVPELALVSGLSTDAVGRLITDETLTSVDDPHIVAAGDAAAPSGEPLRMSCQAAIPLGAQAANTVLARLSGTEPAVINQGFTGQCISLGRRSGTIQISRTDDRPLPLYIGGRAGATIKETVCKTTLAFLRKEARRPGSLFWVKGGKRDVAPAAATR